jgi:uncharacterized membrane protein YozB (DUF420 family)
MLHLPTVNAILNATSAVLLALGYACIRRHRINAHRNCMLLAVMTSTLFLASYLYYHFQVGSVPFRGQGWLRTTYFTILISHTVLAAAIVPLVAITLTRAARGLFDRHASIARFTLPIWMYVSVTGVVVYLMLYRLPLAP